MSYCSGNSPTITQDTLATINSRTISKDEFIAQAESIANTPGVNLTTKDGRINILKDMITEELVFQQALQENFHEQNLDVKHEIVRKYLKQKFSKDLPVITDEQVSQYYVQHKNEIDRIRASHILIKFNKNDAASKSTAKSKAEKIRVDIVSGKISFSDAARTYSEDSLSKDSEGDLNFFPKNGMVAPFSDAAYSLKKIGDISHVVESEYGFHIIKLTGEQRGFDLYKEKIRWKLYQDAMQPRIDDYLKKLRENAKTKIVNEDLTSIKIPMP
jgi:parvulin-like peptidyl-prolyl isomerase